MDLAALLANSIQSGHSTFMNADDMVAVSSKDVGDAQVGTTSIGATPLSTNCKNYCLLCKQFTNKHNQRDQGPRRHILHKHIEKPSFLCPHCDYASKFHKHHIKKHIRDTHPGKDETVIVRDCEEELKTWYKKCFGIEGTNARPGPRTRREKTEFEAKCARLDTSDSAYSSGVDTSILSTPGTSSKSSLSLSFAGPSGFHGSALVSNPFCTPLFTNPFFTPFSGSSSSVLTNSPFSMASSSDSANSSLLGTTPTIPLFNSPPGSPFSPQLQLLWLQTLLQSSLNHVSEIVPDSPEASPNTPASSSNHDSSKPAFFVDNLLS